MLTKIESVKVVDFKAYYQPIINNQTKTIEKFELLVRGKNENDEIISPVDFIQAFKRSNQYHKITEFVIDKGIKMARDTNMNVSINISYEDMVSGTRDYIFRELQKNRDITHLIGFELVEDEKMDHDEKVQGFIETIKEYNCDFIIDDFGRGYDNFDKILQYNPSTIKLDGSLIRDVDKDLKKKMIVFSVVELAKNLDVDIVAEQVENKEILDTICNLGIKYSQGYYFSKPLESPFAEKELYHTKF